MSGEEESISVGEDSEEDSEWDVEDEDDEEEEEYNLGRGRSILWLCQEGQLLSARRRFELLLGQSTTTATEQDAVDDSNTSEAEREKSKRTTTFERLKKEVFQVGADKNYALHEILMGGTSDTNAKTLTMAILKFGKEHYPLEYHRMLSVQPPSHGRTALHWAAWGNANMDILQSLVVGNPEASVIKDNKSHGSRIPLEIFRHYYFSSRRNDIEQPEDDGSKEKIQLFEKATASWTKHRLRLAVHLSAHSYFSSVQQLIPFDKNSRKDSGIKPKPWFLLSVLGYLLQREMKPLVVHILSFLGHNAKVYTKAKTSKRKRSN